jgi:GNAT superfamily N-acetyltransferase
VRRLVREAYARWIPVLGREPLPMRADYERAVVEHEIDLLHEEGRLAGLVQTVARPDPAPDHLFVENVAVAPRMQGRGLGRRLLAHAEEKARAAGFTELRLLTNGAFESNVRLYLSAGFRIDRTEPFMGGTTVFMSKALPAPGPPPESRREPGPDDSRGGDAPPPEGPPRGATIP